MSAHGGLWRTGLLCHRFVALRSGSFAVCSGAPSHRPHQASRQGIVAGQVSALKVARGVFPMSALGQKQTYAVHQPMSALPPIATAKADMCGAARDVRFGPIADISFVSE